MQDAEAVYVIDDDPSMRRALEGLFRSVGLKALTYASINAFIDVPKAGACGCLILDIRLPGVSGLDFQAQMASRDVKLPVVFISGHGNIQMSVRGMKAGAIDFLTKPFRDQDLLDAVERAFKVDRARRSSELEKRDLNMRLATLSKRERQVMQLVTTGKMNKQVAGDLGLSEITVKVHRGAAMRKMGARSLAQLVIMVEHLALPENQIATIVKANAAS